MTVTLNVTDPAGVPFTELTPERLRAQRTSVKWQLYPDTVLPVFVAEMDFNVAHEIRQQLIEQVNLSDFGYVITPGPLADAFADFADDYWGWRPSIDAQYLATDVATGIVETLRLVTSPGARVGVATPVYDGFFLMLREFQAKIVEVPLAGSLQDPLLDLDALESVFANGLEVFVLCNPHNPHGLVHDRATLEALATLAARHGVFVISDEIHAPLVYDHHTFSPFAPIAAAAGARSVTVTSASKGWNIAGTKASLMIASSPETKQLLDGLPSEVQPRSSILGLHASAAAYRDGRDWLAAAIRQIQANEALFTELRETRLPQLKASRPRAGYLSWIDARDAGFGHNPHEFLLERGKVAFSDGGNFGAAGTGHVRLNLACAPETIREAVARVEAALASHSTTRTA